MAGPDGNDVMQRVRNALGRRAPLAPPPIPPAIDEPIARLVYSDIGLPELFQRRAGEMKMLVEPVRIDEVLFRMAEFLKQQNCKSVMLSATPLLEEVHATEFLCGAGFRARSWLQMTADEAYEFDAGVTEVDYAVAETGSLVIRHGPPNGRLLSLTPFVHVAIVKPTNFVPDLMDLFDRLAREGTGSGVTLISGPSKTSDIEMNLVVGVHGPNVVKTYLLS